MKIDSIRHTLACAGTAACLVFAAGCATSKESGAENVPAPQDEQVFVPPSTNPAAAFTPKSQPKALPDKVTLSQSIGTAQRTLRKIAETSSVNLVIMSGIEDREVGELHLTKADTEETAKRIATALGCAVNLGPYYPFIYPSGYEPLLETVVVGKLDPAPPTGEADFSFGSGMYLFNVFQWVGEALGATIVADNAVAQAESGELTLNHVPLDAALEAILRAARVHGVQIESTEDYVFLYSAENRNPQSCLLAADTLDEARKAQLDRRVNLYLPRAPQVGHPIEMLPDPIPLNEALPEISKQLGVLVVAEPGMEDIPINPVVFRDVRVGTALDLLVRQWLLPNYGYQVTSDRIVLRKRLPEEAVS